MRTQVARAKTALAKLREETQSTVVHLRHDTETIAGAGFAGLVRGAFEGTGKDYAIPLPGGIKLAPEIAAGAGLILLAVSGQTDASADFHALGSGVAGFGVGIEGYKWMMARKKGAPSPNGNGGQ